MGLFEQIGTSLNVEVINAFRDAGIAVSGMLVVGLVFIAVLRFLGKKSDGDLASDGRRWDDFMLIWKTQQDNFTTLLGDIKDVVKELRLSRKDHDEKMDQSITEIKRGFEALQGGIRQIHTDIQFIKDELVGKG